MKKKIAAIFAVIFMLFPFNGFSKDIVIVDAQEQFQLAQTLFDEKEFSAAAHEYIRFFHLFPDHEKAAMAKYRTGVSFLYAGRLEDARRHLEKITDHFSDSGFAPDAMFKLSELYMIMDDPVKAASVLRDLITITGNPLVHDRACFLLGWLLLDKADIFQYQSDYKVYPVKEAEKYFSMISDEGKKTYRIDDSLTSLDKIRYLKKKTPAMAGFLSIIPGGGFLYCGRYQDALVSFLLNSSLILAAHHAFENDNDFLGGVLSFVEAGFYAGNIYGSVSSAHKYNRQKQKKIIDQLKQEHFVNQEKMSFQTGYINNGIALMFKYDF